MLSWKGADMVRLYFHTTRHQQGSCVFQLWNQNHLKLAESALNVGKTRISCFSLVFFIITTSPTPQVINTTDFLVDRAINTLNLPIS